MNTLSVKECIGYGWKTFKTRPWFFIGASVVLIIIDLAATWLRDLGQHYVQIGSSEMFLVAVAVTALSAAISFLMGMGNVHFFLVAHEQPTTVALKDLLMVHPFWKFVGTGFLLLLILVPGYILLIVPGVIFSLMFSLAGTIVIDRNLGPIAALKESARITKGNRWKLLLLGLACAGIFLLGFIVVIVGIVVAIPVVMLASIHAYRVLSAAADSARVVPAEQASIAA